MNGESRSSRDVFGVVYPIFKREVYQRRRNMMALCRRGSLAFFLLTLLNVTVLPGLYSGLAAKLMVSAGTLLVATLWVGQLFQERVRYREAKSQMIVLEKQAGFFNADLHIQGQSLYPPKWEKPRPYDPGFLLDLCLLIILGIVSILSIFIA